jgi:hypothetical protein
MNRKGTEKPIEIFVALFVILAIGLFMLKFFQYQLVEQENQLAGVALQFESRELTHKVQLACEQKCVDASNNGCSIASLASLCMTGSHNVLGQGQYLDLDNDGTLGEDVTLLAGIGVCEDHVYCFHLLNSCCSQRISPETCKTILTSYWQSKGLSADQLLRSTVPAGTCATTQAGVKRWDQFTS